MRIVLAEDDFVSNCKKRGDLHDYLMEISELSFGSTFRSLSPAGGASWAPNKQVASRRIDRLQMVEIIDGGQIGAWSINVGECVDRV